MKRMRMIFVMLCLGLMVLGVTGQAMAGYVDNGNGTVTDPSTGLIWEKAGSSATMNWEAALARCVSATTGGYSDWRLPNKRELESLVDDSLNAPSIDPVFTGPTDGYWSGTTYAGCSGGAWCVDFRYGYSDDYGKSITLHVRCVRGGHGSFGSSFSPSIVNMLMQLVQ